MDSANLQLEQVTASQFPSKSHSARLSNMECLRIVAMTMVLMGHLIQRGYGLPFGDLLKSIAPPFYLGGVPLFIMLSGWFGINLRWKGIVRLSLLILGFEVFLVLLSHLIEGVQPVSWRVLCGMLSAPLSHSNYWFIRMYWVLMVISPIINKGLNSMNQKELRMTMILLTICMFYSHWIWLNETGSQSLFMFIWCYTAGWWLRHDSILDKLNGKSIAWIGVASLASMLLLNILGVHFSLDENAALNIVGRWITSHVSSYYNPLLLIFCASLMLTAARFRFQRSWINSLAGASLGAYLLQEGHCLSELGYGSLFRVAKACNVSAYFTLLFFLFIFYWALSWLITQLLERYLIPTTLAFIERILPKWAKFEFKSR